ncbi:MAG: hypothetical protein LBO62_02455 [Endomicrobium sp.]|jgi:hypothetical protein|nr:hypothetical protein [Endomicrobium sp.]
MKNKIIFSFAFLFFASIAFGGELLKISSVENSVSIKLPTGGDFIYKASDDFPEIVYGSRITALRGAVTIKAFNTVDIALEKEQSVFITKNPITNAIELFKRESKNQKPIKIKLAGRANAYVGADTSVALTEQYPSVYFEVKKGRCSVKNAEGKIYELEAGDRYEAKKGLLD